MPVIDINVGRNFIDTFPEPSSGLNAGVVTFAGPGIGFTSSHTYPCSTYNQYIRVIALSSYDLPGASQNNPGVISYSPRVEYPFFTHFISGSGVYIIDALSAFQIMVD